jgi:PAS domain S-box-containing protein
LHLVEQVRDYAIFGIGLDGRITSWNQGVLGVLGYTPEEFIGLDVAELFPPEDRAEGEPQRELAQAEATGSGSDDRWMLRKDGSTFWAAGRVSSIRDPAGKLVGFTKIMRDRTDLKRVDTGLRATADRYEVLVETASDAIITIAPDSTILFANSAVERVFGYAPRELVGRSLTMLMPEELRPQHRAGLASYLATGHRHLDWSRVELPGCHRSGRELRLEVGFGESHDGAEHTFTGVIRDVTARREAERAVLESEARARALIEQSPLPTLIFDLRGRPVAANPAWEQKWGVTLADARAGYTLLDDAQLEAHGHLSLVRRALAGEVVMIPAVHYDLARETGGRGSAFWIQGHFYPIRNAAGELTEIVLVQIDVTDRQRAEAQLRQAERLQAVGTLAGGVAHEVNNQMTAVLGFGQFVLDALGPAHPQTADVTDMLESARRAALITQQLLAFSRRQVTRPVALDMHRLVADLRSVLERILGRDRLLLIAEPETCHTVLADRTQVEQVLINLVANAGDAMPSGGTVAISLDDVRLDEGYGRERGVLIAPGRYVRLVVSDDGSGMDRATLERIFEPFFTTKPVGAGTGLGLSMVYGIVKQHGGFIWAYSEPGHGTAMKVYLPATDAGIAEEAASPAAAESAGAGAGGAMVLVVEDEAIVRAMTRRSLERAGYLVLEASDGHQALTVLESEPRVSVVVTDVVMAGVNGGELGRRLRESHPTVPVIYMSGYPGDDVERRGLVPAGAPFLQKPFSPRAIVAKVGEVLRQWDS